MADTQQTKVTEDEQNNEETKAKEIRENESNDETQAISESKRFVLRMFLVSVFQLFMISSRHPIWILYALQFENTSYHKVSLVLYGGLIWKGLAGLIFASLSNKYGYDRGIVILMMINCVALFMECTTDNFALLSIGFYLTHTGIFEVVISAIAWILPYTYAVKYTLLLNASGIFSFILGPVASGIISYYFSYRSVFWFNCILGLILAIYAWVFIGFNSQKKIEQKQLGNQSTNDDVFPICQQQNNPSMKDINLSKYEWFILIVAIIIHSLAFASIGIVGFYYCLYIIEKMNKSIMHATMQLLSTAIMSIIGTIITRKINLNHHILLLLTSSLQIVIYFCYPYFANIYLLYFGVSICGFFNSMFIAVSQIIMLEFEPLSHAGYVTGITNLLKCVCKAFSLLFVGLFWTKHEEIMFYIMGIIMIICFLLSALMGITHKYFYVAFKLSQKNHNNIQKNIQKVPPLAINSVTTVTVTGDKVSDVCKV